MKALPVDVERHKRRVKPNFRGARGGSNRTREVFNPGEFD